MNAAIPRVDADARSDEDQRATPPSERAWRRARLQIVSLLALGALVAAALWLIIVVVIHTERRAVIEHARSEANNLSAAFQAEVAGKLDAITRAMDLVAIRMRSDQTFNIFVWTHDTPLLTETTVRAASIISPDGKLSSTSLMAHPEPLDVSDRDYFRVHLNGKFLGTFISQLSIGRLSGEAGIRVSRRVDAADGRFLGVIVFSLVPGQLTALPKSVDLGAHGLLGLVGSDNIIRARFGMGSMNGEAGAGTLVPPPPPNDGGPVNSYIRVSSVDHVTRLFSIRVIAGYPLYVAVAFDLMQVLQPAAEHAKQIEAIGLIASLALSALMTLLVVEIRRRTDREVKLAGEQTRLAAEVELGHWIQEQLQSGEGRLRDFAVMASDWFWEQDADLRFTDIGVDAPYPASDGRSHLGKTRWELAGRCHEPEYWDAHKRDLLDRKPFRNVRYSLLNHDGTLHHVSVNGVPVYDVAGQFVGYRGTGRDITMEVEAEAELRLAKERAEQAERLLRDAVDSISEGFVIYDSEDRFVMCNEPYQRLYPEGVDLLVPGARFEDDVRHILAKGGYPDARGREEEWLAERLRRFHQADGSYEQRASDGSWILMIDRRMRNGGIAGLRIDVTALKEAQAALRESEARLDRAQEIAGIGSWELDLPTGRYIWSRQMYRMRGVSPETFQPDIDNVAGFVHPADYPTVRRWLASLAKGHEYDPLEARIVRPDGETRLFRVEGRAVTDPDGVTRRIAGTMQDITALKQAQDALRDSEASLERAQEIAGIGSWELDIAAKRYSWSKQMYRLRGLSPATFDHTCQTVATYVHPDDEPMVRQYRDDLIAGIKCEPVEGRFVHPNGEIRLLRVEGRQIVDADGTVRRLAGTMQDVTERRMIERQLAHAQKMEAIGNLTGGMAHDFNNGLGIIIGNLDLLGRLLKGNPAAEELCDEIRDGALRCADLIRRLLTFARRQSLRPERIDVNALVTGIGKLLSRSLGADIEWTTQLNPSVKPVIADPVQLEAALTNLANNARDSMQGGGRLVISTSNTMLDGRYAEQNPDVVPGEYVLIAVSDTGTGIAPEIISRIFEPFFTTKEPGKGTGLGLSMVFGFVKQSGGHLAVYSELGRGSTFRLYLPCSTVGSSETVAVAASPPIVGGNERVLVVEDNAKLRKAAVQQLTALGYVTCEAEDAKAAIRILAREHVDLLFTDVVMPGEMDGIDLARRAQQLHPKLGVVLTSGFPDLRGADSRVASSDYWMLNKPYRYDELANMIRQVLSESRHHRSHDAMATEPR